MFLRKYSSSFIITIVLFLVSNTSLHIYLHDKIWIILAFFIALDFFVKIIIGYAFDNKSENFIQFYMVSVVSRIIFILCFILIGLYFYPENSNIFVINVFALYLFFTIFEITTLLRKLRRF